MAKRAKERKTIEGRRAPLRAVLVGALAFFLLAQAFSVIGGAVAAKRAFGETIASGAATAFERFCAAGKNGHSHVDHGTACMLCCGGRDWAAPPSRDPYAEASHLFPPSLLSGATFALVIGPAARESGWASSWSSRAPPAIS
ncbi:MAG TPA: hypothetical protein VIF40_17125 [Methylosinus sp.]|jgi:hypothetical protein|uniref:hypothetical protein n=1 Tax=Methylosinus sp. TaxID=427 RepID=UPI002F94907D